MVSRIYVEKKPGFDVEAQQLTAELRSILQLEALKNVRLINRYDVEGISTELFERCVPTVFSEPQSDTTYTELPEANGAAVFAVEYLPGQFDQRADSASECIQLISQGERPGVLSAKVYYLEGDLTDAQVEEVKHYIINPIEAREASLSNARHGEDGRTPSRSPSRSSTASPSSTTRGLQAFIAERGLAMDLDDIKVFQAYFRDEEKRQPHHHRSQDGRHLLVRSLPPHHLRHRARRREDRRRARASSPSRSTSACAASSSREKKPVCLMDLGTIGAKYLKMQGHAEEPRRVRGNQRLHRQGHRRRERRGRRTGCSCSRTRPTTIPTEIEPFGGAATCIGGCIRDPLVRPQLRLPGDARDRRGRPARPRSTETLEGKLPAAQARHHRRSRLFQLRQPDRPRNRPGQRALPPRLCGQAHGDRRRRGRDARRPRPPRDARAPGDVVVLLGGRTGRDGIGGATGSSKAHNVESIEDLRRRGSKGQRARRAQDPAPVPPRRRHAASSSAATTLAPAASPSRSESSPTASSSIWTRSRRNTTASMAPSWPFPKARSAWPCAIGGQGRRRVHRHTPPRRTSRPTVGRHRHRGARACA